MVKAIVTDIEGTTSSISFVRDVLFPYARETIDAMVTRGSFPALMLAPVNFEAIYLQSKQQQAAQAGAASGDVKAQENGAS